MREIQLTQGFIALIDDQDIDLISQYSWCVLRSNSTNYAQTTVARGVNLCMHQLLVPAPAGYIPHHKDGNGLHNWRSNLELRSHSQNLRLGNFQPGVTGERNITLHHTGKYHVRFSIKNKVQNFGIYSTIEEARIVRDQVRSQLLEKI